MFTLLVSPIRYFRLHLCRHYFFCTSIDVFLLSFKARSTKEKFDRSFHPVACCLQRPVFFLCWFTVKVLVVLLSVDDLGEGGNKVTSLLMDDWWRCELIQGDPQLVGWNFFLLEILREKFRDFLSSFWPRDKSSQSKAHRRSGGGGVLCSSDSWAERPAGSLK